MRASIFTLSAIVGCAAPYSNEDLRFARSVPDPERVMIDLPGDTMSGELARYHLQMSETSAAINQAFFDPLAIVQQIADLPPTERDADTRSWGPIQTSTHAAFTLFMIRTATAGVRVPTSTATIVPIEARIDFVLVGAGPLAPEPAPVIYGSFAAIGAGGSGIGDVTVDLEAFGALDPSSMERGRYRSFYDDRDGVRQVFFHEDGQGSVAFIRVERVGGMLDFLSYQRLELFDPGDGAPAELETMTLRGRYGSDQRGRAELWVEGGNIGRAATGAECWDASFRRVFFFATESYLGESEGSVDACAPELRAPLPRG